MNYTGPKVRLSRREWYDLYGNAKKAFKRKSYAPWQAGNAFRKAPTGYGKLLREKQKAKRMFGMSEKQFVRFYKLALKKKGVTYIELLKLLETRLDNVVFKAGLAETIFQARQFVGHGHFMLNGRRVDIPSIIVKQGDVIELREKSKNSKLFKEVLKVRKPMISWCDIDPKKFIIKVVADLTENDIDKSIDGPAIIGFYSRR